MGRTVKKLSGLEIDEVSLVDRPANQHGLVAIAKREDDFMPIFDAEGDEVFEEELGDGDVVYDDAGNEFVYVEDDPAPEGDGEYYDEEQYAEVGKGRFSALGARASGVGNRMASGARSAGSRIKSSSPQARINAGVGAAYAGTAAATVPGYKRGNREAKAGTNQHVLRSMMARPGYSYGFASGASNRAKSEASKSLGDQVLSELSKSLTDSDRDEVIAKAMDYVQDIAQRNEELEDAVVNMAAERDQEDYYELAKSYEVPIDPESVGGLMYRASQYMPAEDVATLDRLFTSVGEIHKSGGFDQIGYDGYTESNVLDQVYAVAGEAISKADSVVTAEQAVTALFSANPEAYDEYEAEQRYNR